ncbi:calmodulin-binding protein 60 F-like isoform X1 [Panicum miliaceum]|uniref:Calmodulin-binding protein 60 F-like isoform X1 n=1 Tax=Panicum miliaceum TaxID=4540 RepID=A0A3L6RQI4_PANMI|nr:calmodulin-binding protein 60 F-like isoform X1 [Panicum miliaceum]
MGRAVAVLGGSKDFYEGQIEILKKEMQCMSKGFIEERKTFQRAMQEFYQNSQLQLKEHISEQNRMMEQLIREQFNTLISEIHSPGDHVPENRDLRALSHQSKVRTCRLKFENKCCNDKYPGHVIMADDGNPITVAVYGHGNKIITEGPLSSLQVKVVVLDGEFNKENKEQWSRESFLNSIVVYGRTRKPPLLARELYVRLENGVANLCGIKFQDNVPGRTFRLGVMEADDSISEKILEGISEPFTIKSGRGFSNRKDPHPSLSDPIYKLQKIHENGDRHRLLEKMHINQVHDFLWFYNKDADSLRKACKNISDHDWNIIVKHALSCKPGHERYSYHIPAKDATMFFDSLYKIVGAEFNGTKKNYICVIIYDDIEAHLYPNNMTRHGLVEVSKKKAYDNLKLVQHEGKNSFQEHQEIVGDKGISCRWGSSSISQFPSPLTRFHDDISPQGEVSESAPAQESPRPRQRWAKIMTVVTTLHFLNKKPQATPQDISQTPPTEGSFGMTYVSDNLRVEADIEMCPIPLIEIEDSFEMAELPYELWDWQWE